MDGPTRAARESAGRERQRRSDEDARKEMLDTERWVRAQALQAASRAYDVRDAGTAPSLANQVLELARIYEAYIEEGTWPSDPEAR